MFHLHHMQGVLYSHRSNFLHAFVVVMPDSLDLSSASCVLAVVPMFHVSRAAVSASMRDGLVANEQNRDG